MHGLFQVAPNHACRCWKPIPAEIVGCFSLQDLLTGPACLFHFCAVQFRGKHPPSLEVQAKTLPPQHICSMVKTWYMVYGHSPSGIPDSGYINPYSWIDGKSFTMAQAHARETGESEDHLPPQKMGGSQEGNCSLRGVLPISFDFDMDIVFATAISGLYNTILMFVAADHGWMGYLSTFITAIIYSCRWISPEL